jgi:hypothetical protein
LGKSYNNYKSSPFIQSYQKNINQPIYNATDKLLNYGSNIPRFQISRELIGKAIPASKTPVGQTVTNIALGIPESILNIPRNLTVGYSRLEKEKLGAIRGKPVSLQNIAAGVAPLAESALDIASFGTVKTLAKEGGKAFLKQGVGQAFKQGAKTGALYGGAGGLSYGVGEQYGKKFNTGEVVGTTLMGASLGGILGGSVSALGALKQSIKYPKDIARQLREANGRYIAGDTPVKPLKMNQKVWDNQIAFNKKYNRNPYEMVTSNDLNEAIKYELKKKQPGLSVRDVNLDKKPLSTSLDAKAGLPKFEDVATARSAGKLSIDEANLLGPSGERFVSQAGLYDTKPKVFEAGEVAQQNGSAEKALYRSFLSDIENRVPKSSRINEALKGRDTNSLNYDAIWQKAKSNFSSELQKSKELGFNKIEQYNTALKMVGEDATKLKQVAPLLNEINNLEVAGKNVPMELQTQVDRLVAQQPLSEVTTGIKSTPLEGKTPILTTKAMGFESVAAIQKQQQKLLQKFPGVDIKKQEPVQALDDIIAQGRKQIGGKIEDPKVSIKKTFDDFYTQWVDRYNPVTRVSKKVKSELKTKGAMLRPEVDPEYLVRRLSGAGGIADYRFRTELNPVLKEIEATSIPKIDMDTYLANKRMAAFGTIERDIYGNDPVKAGKIVEALDQKYGTQLSELTDKLYAYQDKGFQEMVDAGFISPEVALKIKSQNPDYAPLYRVMDDVSDYLGLPTKKLQQGTQPIQKIKGSKKLIESPIESIIGNTFSQRAAIEKNAVAKSIVGLQDVMDVGFKKVSKSAPDTITVWKNGEKEYWQVGQDVADTAKGANEEAMNLVLKIVQAPAALLRQGATGRNPEFMLPNIIRDQLDAGVTSKYGYIPFVDYVSGLKSMLTNDDVYKKWQSSGAKIALGEMSGKKSIKQMFETAKTRQGLFKKLASTLDFMGKYSEEPTRVGLFKKAYKKTGNELLSVMESRDSTVDFARMGSKMAVANRIIPFLNVGVQGFDKLIRSVKNNPGKVLLNAALYGVAPASALAIYNLKNYPQEYAEIPQYEKDSNFVLVKGRNEDGTVDYITFPKGNVIPTIANPIQSFIEYAYGNDKQSFKEMALQTLSSTLPVVGDGQSLQEIALKTIGSNLPQAVKPLAENLLNKSFWKYDTKKEQTKEIVPSYLQKQEPYKQAYEWTPAMYKGIGSFLNVSPLKVQNLMEGYLAGYVKVPSQIIDMMVRSSKGQEIEPNQKTILRRFIKQTYPSSGAPPAEQPPKTPLMERITGKVSAAGKDQKIAAKYWYTDESGYSKSLDVGKVASMPSASGYEKILKDKESFSMVSSILDNLPPEKQAVALQQLGISIEDATYYNVARQPNDVKSAWINDEISKIDTKDRGKMLDYLISQRKEVNGYMILANGVVDQLYEDGIISKSEKTMLKNLTIKNGKVNTKLTGRGRKTAIKKVSAPGAPTKISAPKIKTMAQLLAKSGKIRTKNYNFKKTL